MLKSALRLYCKRICQHHSNRWKSNSVTTNSGHQQNEDVMTESEREVFLRDGLDGQGHQWEPGFGPVDTGWLLTRKEFKNGVKMLMNCTKQKFRKIKHSYTDDDVGNVEDGIIYKVFTFEEENCLSEWPCTSDKEQEIGQSTCSLTRTPAGTLLFTGNLCTEVPSDGRTFRTGFAAFRSPRKYTSYGFRDYYDWDLYNYLIIKLRGDGRIYNINIGQDVDLQPTWYDMSSYFIFTRGGPYWQTVKIPFSKLISACKGYARDEQFEFCPSEVSFLGITLQDTISGPFSLEIEYIGLGHDFNNDEETAYEGYDADRIFT